MSSASSAKRKRPAGTAFYAVKVGRTPGVYHSWDDTKRQTEGVRAVCKSTYAVALPATSALGLMPTDKKFDSLTEAEAFVKGSSSKPKFYGVAVGHVPGVYADWASVQAQTKGCPGAKQKAFSSRDEALAWVSTHKRDASVPISLRGHLSDVSPGPAMPGHAADHTPKRQKKADGLAASALPNGDIEYEPGMGPLPPGAEDGFDRTITMDLDTGAIRHKTGAELSATKRQPTGDASGPIIVYTDGSSLGNGKAGAVAGVGVYFGPSDAR
jgi:ribonuclease HI